MAAPVWWRDAVCYQVYLRSFADGNGDGVGDLTGLIEKLDYLQWLGVGALWVSPFYPSAQIDWGYDVSDYTAVHADYGTLADVERLIEAAHQRGIRILLDMVLNHTSYQHTWFQQSKSSRTNMYRDWYIWRDGRGGGPPNDWGAIFGGSAWTFDETTGQYCYHYFFPEQPDLNWRNPQVKQAMFSAMRFWLERGVDGFRLDAIGALYENRDLPDSQTEGSLEDLFIQSRLGLADNRRVIRNKVRFQVNQPEIHPLLHEFRTLVDEFDDRVLLGETEDIDLYGDGTNELHSVFNFPIIEKLEAEYQRSTLISRLVHLPEGAWECNTVGNHDRRRSYTYFSDGVHNEARARLALALAMLLPGTPVFYNGEEIGMQDFPPPTLDDFRDTFGTRGYKILRDKYGLSHDEAFVQSANFITRDGCRTPMQWGNGANAGFSQPGVRTWLPVNPDYTAGINVEEQVNNPESMIHFFRLLVELRQQHNALRRGGIEIIEDTGPVLAFWRAYGAERFLVGLNMSGHAERFSLGASNRLTTIYRSSLTLPREFDPAVLLPYEFYIARSG